MNRTPTRPCNVCHVPDIFSTSINGIWTCLVCFTKQKYGPLLEELRTSRETANGTAEERPDRVEGGETATRG